MHPYHRRLATFVAAAGALGLAACGSGTPTTATERSPMATFASVGEATNATPVAGQIKVCKTGNDGGTFTVTSDNNASSLVAAPSVAVGTCIVVAQNNSESVASTITVTETPATYLTPGTTYTGNDFDGTLPFTNGVTTVIVNAFHGRTITFNNDKPAPPVDDVVALFVIGDVEPHAIGDNVNFWGAQWWKNNFMSGVVSKGVAAFKGYATQAGTCGETWVSLPGNSSNPPDVIPDQVAIIVTSKVLKVGPNISGDIRQILLVQHDGKYGPAPGKRGNGPVVSVVCTAD